MSFNSFFFSFHDNINEGKKFYVYEFYNKIVLLLPYTYYTEESEHLRDVDDRLPTGFLAVMAIIQLIHHENFIYVYKSVTNDYS